MLWLILVVVIVGAFCGTRTLAHAIAVAFDMFAQAAIWDAPIGVTISSRAGLAARSGAPRWANLICAMFRNPDHCEQAIKADIARARQALELLED